MSVETQPQSSRVVQPPTNGRQTRQSRRRSRPLATVDQRLRVALCREGVTHQNPGPKEIAAALQSGAGTIWADAQGDPAVAIPQLQQLFALPPAIVEALRDEASRARLLENREVYALAVHGIGFDEQTEEAVVSKLDIVFGKGFLITLHRESADWIDNLWSEASKDTGDESLMGRGLPRLLHTILDTLVDSYFPVIDTLDDLIDQLEDATINDTSNAVQLRLFRMKRAVATLRRVISPQVELANSLITRTGALIPTEIEPYFADVRDHTLRVFEMLDSYRDLLSGLLDVYLTTVSNRLNQVMKQLTIIATIFMPITFITGVFGMNFGRSPQVEYDTGWNFWFALLVMGAITATQLWYFRRRGWL